MFVTVGVAVSFIKANLGHFFLPFCQPQPVLATWVSVAAGISAPEHLPLFPVGPRRRDTG